MDKNKARARDTHARFKAVVLDYDYVFSLATDRACYALSEREISLIISALDVYHWDTRWTESANMDNVRALVDSVVNQLMNVSSDCGGGIMFQLRQNADETCILEQSLDGGETWLAAFDFSLCQAQAGTTEYYSRSTSDTVINVQNGNDYDGTPVSINVNVTFSTFDNGGSEGIALCMAVKQYVERQFMNALNLKRIGLGLTALGAGVLGLAGGGLGAIAGGIAVFLAAKALEDFESAAANRDAIDAVICNLFDALSGVTITNGNFTAAISGLTAFNGDEQTIIDVLVAGSSDQSNYLWFIDLLGNAVDLQDAGVNDCPCGEEWCYHFDFTGGDQNGWNAQTGSAYPSPDNNWARWNGNGWKRGGDQLSYQTAEHCIISRAFSGQVTGIELHYSENPGGTGSRGLMYKSGLTGFLTGTSLTRLTTAFSITGLTLSVVGGMTIGWRNDLSTVSSPIPTTAILQGVTLRGTGVNPFGTDNCS